jgi:nickel/cobalt transporter (NicO) family protein
MNETAVPILLSTAVGIAFVHTLIGVDHTLPFVVLAKAQRWTMKRLVAIITLCGVGHVLSSIALGAIGIGAGVALERLEWIEGFRGEWAAWLLITFGLVYAIWGTVRRFRGKRHSHWHAHFDGLEHDHDHDHNGQHLHPHSEAPKMQRRLVTFWTLFIIFAFGPCEPLIPLLMAPAWAHNWAAVVGVASLFAVVTVGTMVLVAALAYRGLQSKVMERLPLERWADALAGLAIAASGGAIKLLGI